MAKKDPKKPPKKSGEKGSTGWAEKITQKPLRAAVAGGAILAGTAGIALRGCDPDKPDIRPAARSHAETDAVNQEQINQQYAEIYATIERAKHNAQAVGKPLVILVGENHVHRNDFLLECMVMDAARRQGIRDICLEAPDKGLADHKNQVHQLTQGYKQDVRWKNADSIKRQWLDGCSIPSALQELFYKNFNGRNITEQGDARGWHRYYNMTANIMIADLSDMNVHAVDHPRTIVDYSVENSLKREKEMARRIEALGKDCVGILGYAHVAAVAKRLDDSGVKVCLIAPQRAQFFKKDLSEGVDPIEEEKGEKFTAGRVQAMRERMDIGVPASGRGVNSAGEAFWRATVASLTHQQKRGETKMTDAQMARNIQIMIQANTQPRGASR